MKISIGTMAFIVCLTLRDVDSQEDVVSALGG